MGWCTFAGCSEAFSSWEAHVEHHKQCHIAARDLQHFCLACLERPPPYERQAHAAQHQSAGLPCQDCAAAFTSEFSRAAHGVRFHRRAAGAELAAGFCFCGRRSASWEEHAEHYLEQHWRGDPALMCRLCLDTSPDRHAAENHGARHVWSDRYGACPLCTAHLSLDGKLKHHGRLYHRL